MGTANSEQVQGSVARELAKILQPKFIFRRTLALPEALGEAGPANTAEPGPPIAMSLSAWQRWWLLVATACLGCLAAAAGDDSVAPETCSDLVAAYARDHGGHGGKDTHNKFVFFLHVPRTAGKTYATCFLRAAVPPSKRCAPSYDGLHLNVSQAGCTYIVSHDDYSIIEVSRHRQAAPLPGSNIDTALPVVLRAGPASLVACDGVSNNSATSC